ncbi:adhesive domain-containing protein [Weissella kandleri]|uniref:adhesive domain-containing protein n=1 Tax=Weissella kandleri TaxID=1616 RepID=UPI00387E4FBC
MKKSGINLVVGTNRITRKKLYKSKKVWMASLMVGVVIGSSGVGPITNIFGVDHNLSHSVSASVVHGEIFSDIQTLNDSGTTDQNGLDPLQTNNVNFTISGGSAVDVSVLGDNQKYAVLGIPTDLQGKVVANGPAQVTTNVTVPLDKFTLLKTNLDLIHTFVTEANRLQSLNPALHIDLAGVNNALDAVETVLGSTRGSYNSPINDNGTYLSADIGTGSSEIIANNLVTALSQLETAVNNTQFTGLGAGTVNNLLSVPKKAAIDALEISKTGLKTGGTLFNQIADISLFGATTVVMSTTINPTDNLNNGQINSEKFVGTMANPNFITVDLFTNSSGASNVFIGKEQVDDLAAEKQAAIDEINGLKNLEAGAKQGYIDQVNAAKTTGEINQVVDAAKVADQKALDDAKASAKTEIGKMANLDDAAKQGYVDRIENATTVAEVEQILAEAQAANQAADDLAAEKQAAIDEINGLKNLEAGAKQDYINQVNEAKTTGEITKIVDAAKAADQKALDDAKASAKTEIGKMANLDDVTKQGYVDRVENATTVAEVEQILAEAQAANQAADDLAAEKQAAIDEINGLKNLDKDQEQDYIDQVNNAKTADEITKIVDAAKAADQKALDDAKASAKTEIGKMANLDDATKQEYVDRVDNATTVAEVEQILAEAQAANQAADDLTAEKQAAIDQINGLKNLDKDQKQGYIDQVNGAKTTGEIKQVVDAAKAADQKALDDAKASAKTEIGKMANLDDATKQGYVDRVENATTVAEVEQILAEAQAANQAADDLAAEKQAAIDQINGLKNLEAGAKQGYIDQVNEAKTTGEIKQVVDAAKAADQKALDDAKASAKTEIGKMANLDDATKQGYVDRVENATTVAEVEQILAEAQAANQAADDLAAEKQAAIDQINGLKNLEAGAKQGYIDQVNEAKTTGEIKQVVDAAKAADQKALDDAKASAKTEIGKMANLDDAAKQGYVNRVENATTVAEVEQILAEAQAANQAADDLAAEKQAAIDQINGLKNLDKDQKQDYINQVNNAKTGDEITKIVDAAKAADQKAGADKLAGEKKNAIDEINGLKNLDKDQKQGYIDQVNNAKTGDEITKIVDAAKAADQ